MCFKVIGKAISMDGQPLNEDEVLSCVMRSLAVAPLLDIASDMDVNDLQSSMNHLLQQFYENKAKKEALQV